MALVDNKDIVAIDTEYNFFNKRIVRTSTPTDLKPPESGKIKTSFPGIEFIEFRPYSYITPMEKIIQRLILKQMKKCFDGFKGTEKEFNDQRFEIHTSTIVEMLGSKKHYKLIQSAFKKLIDYKIDLHMPYNPHSDVSQKYTGIFDRPQRHSREDKRGAYYSFHPSPLFQAIRQERFRNANALEGNIKKVIYTPIHTTLLDIAKLDNKYKQQFILFLLDIFEQSNRKQQKLPITLNDEFFSKLTNKKEKNITRSDYDRYKKAINELNASKKYKGQFEIVGKILNVIF